MRSFRANTIRLLFGYDVFISYSRADSATYAARLASELTARGFFCRLDQWGSKPGKEVPQELLKDVRRSSMLVVVGSAAAAASSAVETEIREFLPTKRFIVPVNTDGAIRSARWWPLLEGLAVVEEPFSGSDPTSAPARDTVERIDSTATFTRRTVRLRRFAVSALAIFGVLAGSAAVAGWRAGAAARLAATESARAESATKNRIDSERARAEAENQASTSKRVANEQRGLAATAVSAREQAERQRAAAEELRRHAAEDARRQQGLAADANREREAAEAKRAEALALLQKTENSLKQQTAVAESRELARQASEQAENQGRLQKAILAAEAAPTDAAREVLADAVRKVINTTGGGPYAVDPRGGLVAIAGRHGQGVLMDLNSGRTTHLCGSPEPIGLLSFSPNSNYLLTARFHHSRHTESISRPIWEYQLWDTRAGAPMGSAFVEWGAEAVKWSPDSSMFLAFQMLKTYRVRIGPAGTLTATEQPTNRGSERGDGVVFSEDLPLFLTHSSIGSSGGVSLWDYGGNQLWSSEPVSVEWAAFRDHGSRVVIARWNLGGGNQFEILRLDAKGRPTGPSTLVAASQFDYRMLAGPRLPYSPRFTLGSSLDENNPSVIGHYGCRRVVADFDVGLALCTQDKVAPILFDVATLRPAGVLKGWAFGDVGEDPVFSPDGGTLVVISDRGLTAWDTATRELRWKVAASARTYGFSTNGKRVVPATHREGVPLVFLDAQTGKTIGALSTKSWGTTVWVNHDGTRVITAEAVRPGERGNEALVLWDVDRSAELRRIELVSVDKAEEERDLAAIKGSPGVPELLEVARRRLRVCEDAPVATP